MNHERIVAPFTAQSTAQDVVSGLDLSGKSALITGAASGLGMESARALASAGARVTLAVPNPVVGADAVQEVMTLSGATNVESVKLDLADRNSIAALAENWGRPLDMLINSADIMAMPDLNTTAEGWELHFAVNHLGHFALAQALYPALVAASGARIVAVSSNAHRLSPVVFEDIHFRNRPYDPWLAYAQSKTANILFAVEATQRWAADGITANAMTPGSIRTAPQRYLPAVALDLPADYPWKSVEQGAATVVLLAASPFVEGIGGRYFEDASESQVASPETLGRGVQSFALDRSAAQRLWDVSEDIANR